MEKLFCQIFKKTLIVSSLFFLLSCVTVLQKDPVMYAVKANYPSIPFEACNQSWLGNGVCKIRKGENLNYIGLSIDTYFKGTIRIISNICGIDETYRYEKTTVVEYEFKGIAEESCIVSFLVSPEYPTDPDQDIIRGSFKGHLLIKVTNDEWSGYASKVRVGGSDKIIVPVRRLGSGRIVLNGCGVNYDHHFLAVDHMIEIELSDVAPNIQEQTCIMDGAVIIETDVVRVSWLVSVYNADFVPLSIPIVKVKKKFFKRKLYVEAETSVSFIMLDYKHDVGFTGKFRFKEKEEHELRLITVGGRAVYGKYKNGEWTWMN